MKKMLPLFLAAAVSSALFAADDGFVKFPAADRKGGIPLQQALNARQTIRKYQDKKLTAQQTGDLLWSAAGVNRANGKRTAPTAVNRQEILLYFLTADGAFAYCPVKHRYKKINSADLRQWAGVFSSPLYIVIAVDLDKAANKHYAAMDTGYVSQNIYLHCASAGLGTCAIGSFNRIKGSDRGKKLRDGLKLPENVEIYLTHSVGIPAVK